MTVTHRPTLRKRGEGRTIARHLGEPRGRVAAVLGGPSSTNAISERARDRPLVLDPHQHGLGIGPKGLINAFVSAFSAVGGAHRCTVASIADRCTAMQTVALQCRPFGLGATLQTCNARAGESREVTIYISVLDAAAS
jgi:hypothetical protein